MYQHNALIPTHTDVRFPHEEVLRDVIVAGHEVLASWAVCSNEIYQYCVKINDVVIKGLNFVLRHSVRSSKLFPLFCVKLGMIGKLYRYVQNY